MFGKRGDKGPRVALTKIKGTSLQTRVEINGTALSYTLTDGTVEKVDLQDVDFSADSTPGKLGFTVNPSSTMEFKTLKVFTKELPLATTPAPETLP